MTANNDTKALNRDSTEGPMDGNAKLRRWMELHRFDPLAIEKWEETAAEEESRPIVDGNTIRVARAIGSADMEGSPWAEGQLFMPGMLKEFLDDRKGEEVTLLINSPGGSSFSGRECAYLIEAHEGKVTAQITSMAASAAAIMAQACDRVEIYEAGMVMIHPPSTFTHGNAKALREQADMLEKLEGSAVKILGRRMGEEIVRESFEKGDTWFDSADCLSNKFADALIEPAKKEGGEKEKGDKDADGGNEAAAEEKAQAQRAEESRKTEQAMIALACA